MNNKFEMKIIHSLLINKKIPKGLKLESIEKLENKLNNSYNESFHESIYYSDISQLVIIDKLN